MGISLFQTHENILQLQALNGWTISFKFGPIFKHRIKKTPGASFIKRCAETILNLILRSFLRYAYVWFIEWTYEQKSRVRVSFRCEIYESQMILNLRAIEWFQLSAL